MKIYIDFDGVIVDTEYRLKEKLLKENINVTLNEYSKNYNWHKLLMESNIIADSLNIIKKSKYDINLLSKISIMNEGIEKVKYLRDNNVNIDIHLVPNTISKSDMVNPLGNILIDDKVYNLDEWSKKGGIGIFFNKDNSDVDIKGVKNTKYKKICNLNMILDEIDISKL